MNERLWSLATPRGVQFDAISRGGLPEMTAEDVALAAAGLPRLPFFAAMFSLAGDDSVRSSLKWGLMEHLLAERESHQWAAKCDFVDGTRGKFSEQLVELFLLEERSPSRFQAAPNLRSILMGVEADVWRRVLAHQWMCVASEYARWRIDAEEHVRRKSRRG